MGKHSDSDLALILVIGPPGVGKTTVANIVSNHLNAEHLRSDIIRKELFEQPDYSSFETCATYSELFKRASMQLKAGTSVIIDATFDKQSRREYANHIANLGECELEIIQVKCSPETVKRRLAQRTSDASDADYEIYEEKRDHFDPIHLDYYTVNNSGSIDKTRTLLMRKFF